MQETRLERTLSDAEAARLLRDIAAELERAPEMQSASEAPCAGAVPPVRLAVPIAGFRRIELTLKRRAEGTELKLRVRLEDPPACVDSPAAAAPPVESGRERYKRLKKRMEETFKTIRRSVKEGQLPRPEDLAAFAEDAARMVTYPGRGDEQYEAFLEACDELRAACDAGDLAGARGAVVRLRGFETSCHDQHR